MKFRLRPEAEADIRSISLYIAQNNPLAARKWVKEIKLRCEYLSEMPRMGKARDDVRPNLRLFPFGNYLILYQQQDGGVDIVRVLHSARQWQELLSEDGG